MACNAMQRRLRRRINYFLKLTQPSSIAAIDAGRHDRGHFSSSVAMGRRAENQRPTTKSPVAHTVYTSPTPQPSPRAFRLTDAAVRIRAWPSRAARLRRDGAPQEWTRRLWRSA